MATTFSNNYQIKLIGTGLEAGTWGDSTNLNYQKLEQAIGGNTSITLDGTLPTGSSYASNVLKLVTNELVDPSDSGAEPRSHYIKITNGSALTATQEVEFCGSSETSSADRVFIVENALNLSATEDQYGDLILRSINGSTGINLPHGSIAVVYTDGDELYNALSQLFITSLDMSEAAADIIINNSNASALEILDNRTNSSSNEFERDIYLKIGTDSTPSFDVFPTINTTSELEDSTFTVQSDKNTFGTDTSGTTPYIEGKGTRGLETRGGSSGNFSKLGLNHGTNSDVDLVTTGTGSTVVGSGSVAAVVKSNGDFDLTLKTGNSTTGSINIEDGASGQITIAPNGSGGDILLSIDNSTAIGSAANGVLIPDNSHLNFKTTLGNGGYGIRSNGGKLEIRTKESTGSWGTPYNAGMASATDGTTGFFKSSANLNRGSGNLDLSQTGTENHGLSTVPRIVQVRLVCIDSGGDNGYAQNDEIIMPSYDYQGRGMVYGVNATAVFYVTGPTVIKIPPKTGYAGADVDLTLSKWDIFVSAWK